MEFLSLTGGCIGLSESIHVKMPHCWKSHVAAQLFCPVSKSYCLSDSGDLSLEKLYENSWKKFSERDFLKVKSVSCGCNILSFNDQQVKVHKV